MLRANMRECVYVFVHVVVCVVRCHENWKSHCIPSYLMANVHVGGERDLG